MVSHKPCCLQLPFPERSPLSYEETTRTHHNSACALNHVPWMEGLLQYARTKPYAIACYQSLLGLLWNKSAYGGTGFYDRLPGLVILFKTSIPFGDVHSCGFLGPPIFSTPRIYTTKIRDKHQLYSSILQSHPLQNCPDLPSSAKLSEPRSFSNRRCPGAGTAQPVPPSANPRWRAAVVASTAAAARWGEQQQRFSTFLSGLRGRWKEVKSKWACRNRLQEFFMYA